MRNNDFTRQDVIDLIPEDARTVLDLGCGTARMLATLREQRPEVATVGVDIIPESLDQEARAGVYVCADLNNGVGLARALEGIIPDEGFDCVVMADVLEHLRDPWALLERVRDMLAPEGHAIVSVPNVRNRAILAALAEGMWTYQPSGLMDRSHMRWFTKHEMEIALDAAGLRPGRVRSVPSPEVAQWMEAGKPGTIHCGRAVVHDLSEADALELLTEQWVFVAQRAMFTDWGLTTICVPVRNCLAQTRDCLTSIQTHTQEPHELIVVDNGSTDGTPDWIAHMFPEARVIRNDYNAGWPRAINQGLALANGSQFVMLNNDTVVTPGWLRRLITALRTAEEAGAVGPRTQNCSGPQVIRQYFHDLNDMDKWAWWWSLQRRGEVIPLQRLVGFCIMMDTTFLREIGGLDEGFGIGNYDDDDLGRRVMETGKRLYCANDAFVYHAGQVTFRAEGIDYAALMAQNAERFRQKWQGLGA